MEALKRYLADQKLTQQDFATTMGVTQPTVWGWLNGTPPSTDKLVEIADKTGLTTDQLLGRTSSRRTRAA